MSSDRYRVPAHGDSAYTNEATSMTETLTVEFSNGSSTDADADGDLLPDWWEVLYGYDPGATDSDVDGLDDPDEDPDGDGRTNLAEYESDSDPGVYDTRPTISDGGSDVSCSAAGDWPL